MNKLKVFICLLFSCSFLFSQYDLSDLNPFYVESIMEHRVETEMNVLHFSSFVPTEVEKNIDSLHPFNVSVFYNYYNTKSLHLIAKLSIQTLNYTNLLNA